MKKFFIVNCFISVIILFVGCTGKTYEFKKNIDEIKSIEIVSAENSLNYTLTKTLSETERNVFIKKFQTISFFSYFGGDPMSVGGDAVKITYKDGDYEIICNYWAEYVKKGEVYYVRKNCDKNKFNELIYSFLD